MTGACSLCQTTQGRRGQCVLQSFGWEEELSFSHYNGYCLPSCPSAWHLVTKEGLLAGYMWKSTLHKLRCIHCSGVFACPHMFVQVFLDRKMGCSPTLCYFNSPFPCSLVVGLPPLLFPKHSQSLGHFTFGL